MPMTHFDPERLQKVLAACSQDGLYGGVYQNHNVWDASYENFQTLPYITKDDLAKGGLTPMPEDGSVRLFRTGGTTGITGFIEWYDDDITNSLEMFDVLFEEGFIDKSAYSLSTVSSNMSLYGVTADSVCKRQGLKHISVGTSAPIFLGYIESLMKKYPIQVLFSTPVGLLRLLSKVDHQYLEQIKMVVVAGAPLRLAALNEIKKSIPYARIVDHYGCTETNCVGLSCHDSSGFHVNPHNTIIEILNPDENGVGKVAITSLYNTRQPILKFINGDLGRLSFEPCSCGSPFPKLQLYGRDKETVYVDGTKVGAFQIDEALSKLGISAPFQLLYELKDGVQEYLSLSLVSLGQICSAAEFVEALQEINPRLALKIKSGEVGFRIGQIRSEELLKATGDKFPRMLGI